MSLPYPEIDPVALQLGPVAIRWYSLAYIGGLAAGWFYLSKMIANKTLWTKAGAPLSKPQLDDALFWVALGVMGGGRLGYVLFYDTSLLWQKWEPILGFLPFPPALMLWQGGMSFHGGLIGVTIAGLWFARRHKLPPLSLGDLFAAAVPIGIFFGRMANFINAELYGRPWNGPWSMVFPSDPAQVPRHPSQLYEALLEGIVLFILLRFATHSLGFLKRPGAVTGLFLASYAVSRIIIEQFREPDSHLSNLPLGLTMGIILSTPMLLLGIWLIWRTRPKTNTKGSPAT